MIQRQTVTVRDIPRTTTHAPRRQGSASVLAYLQKLSQGWARAWNPCSLEQRIDREVRFHIRRGPEPGDELFVNMIVEELSR